MGGGIYEVYFLPFAFDEIRVTAICVRLNDISVTRRQRRQREPPTSKIRFIYRQRNILKSYKNKWEMKEEISGRKKKCVRAARHIVK